MRFSIITATKNAGDEIESTIKSVISQKDVDLEYIIIDSVSNDNTLDIIEKYVNDYPIKLISEADDGISDAFNKGIKLSTGDWIIFMGAGDIFLHHKVLSDMELNLKKKYKSLIVWGNIIFINKKGETGKTISGKFPKGRLKRYMCMPHQAAFHNREFFQKYGVFDTNFKIAMDYDLLLRFIDKINESNYIDYDVTYMLTGGYSQNNIPNVLKEFLEAKIKNHVCSRFVGNAEYYWARFKNFLKELITDDPKKL